MSNYIELTILSSKDLFHYEKNIVCLKGVGIAEKFNPKLPELFNQIVFISTSMVHTVWNILAWEIFDSGYLTSQQWLVNMTWYENGKPYKPMVVESSNIVNKDFSDYNVPSWISEQKSCILKRNHHLRSKSPLLSDNHLLNPCEHSATIVAQSYLK